MSVKRRVHDARRRVAPKSLIPAVVIHRGQDVEVEHRLRREADDRVRAQQRAEHERGIAAGRAARDDEPLDLMVLEHLAQRLRDLGERRAVAGDAAVIPGLAQIAHEQPFDRHAAGGEREELEGRDADLPDHAAEGEQQRARVTGHVQAQRSLGILQIAAEAPSLRTRSSRCTIALLPASSCTVASPRARGPKRSRWARSKARYSDRAARKFE